ncbi:MAG: sigma 54-interacting transcriptional regulator, partial [Pseudolabrys sp.]
HSPETFLGHSTAAEEARAMLARLTTVPFSALVITGETGSGKGLAARIVHHSGQRAGGPLVELNCAALPHDLLESELFGHEAGAFTGAKGRRRGLMEQANGGTLFLDEIGEMNLELRTKLLKAIEDRTIRRLGGDREIPIDVQMIAASNRDLQAHVQEGKFRSDLYHRLSVFHVHMPPLRDRIEDLEDLVPQFITEYNAKARRQVSRVPAEVWDRFRAHHWPGNVRELRNVVERCVLFAEDETFPIQWLQLGAADLGDGYNEPSADGEAIHIPLNGRMSLDEMDRYIIKTALERNRFNVTATARALGTTRETLRYRITKYNLKPSA